MWKIEQLHKTYEYGEDKKRVLVREIEDYVITPFPYGWVTLAIALSAGLIYVMLELGA